MRKIRIAAAALLLACLAAAAGAKDMTLVRGGKSDYVIAVAADASPQEQLAAAELARYLKQISGAELPIVRFPTDKKCVAVEDVQHYLFRAKRIALPTLPGGSDEFSVYTDGDDVVLHGASGRAVLTATYRLLDSLGCRFLAPDFSFYQHAAEVVPSAKTLVVHDDAFPNRWIAPKLKFRKLYVEEGHSHNAENLKQLVEWMPKVGYNTLVVPTNYQGHGRVKWDNWRKDLTPELQKRGITIEVGGHGYQNFLAADMPAADGGTLFDKHPDWFGADKSGARHRESEHWIFCTSNVDARAALIGHFLAYIKDRSEIQIYDFWPPDGAHWCECDACKALGTPSDRQAILLSQVKQAAAKVRPDLRLEMIAYSSYLQPPEHQRVDKDVLVDFCPINQQFDVQIDDPSSKRNKEYADALVAWRKSFAGDMSIYSYYRKYAWDSLPVVIPHYVQNDLRWYAGIPVQGVSTYSEPGDWATYELNHYALAALAWDPNIDVDALVKKFCDARYGGETKVARSALGVLEGLTRVYGSVPNVPLKPAGEIEQAQARARAAAAAVADAQRRAADPATERALERLGLMFEYAIRDLEIQHLRAAAAPGARVYDAATALHAWVKSHAADGVFLVTDNRLTVQRMRSRYGVAAQKRGAATSAPAAE